MKWVLKITHCFAGEPFELPDGAIPLQLEETDSACYLVWYLEPQK